MLKKLLLIVPILLISVVGGVYFFANNQAAVEVDKIIAQLIKSGAYQEISYSSVEIGLNGNATLIDLHVIDQLGNDFIISKLNVSDFDFQNKIPEHMTLNVDGLRLPNGLPNFTSELINNPALEKMLDAVSLNDSIPLTINYHYDYTPENNLHIESMIDINLGKAGTISFSSQTKNIPLETFLSSLIMSPEDAQSQFKPFLASAEIPQINLTLEDLGLLDLVLEARADTMGVSTEALRQQIQTQAQSLIFFAPPAMQKQAAEISQELITFLDGDKTFTLSIAPEFNGSIRLLQSAILGSFFRGEYEKIFELFNIELSSQ